MGKGSSDRIRDFKTFTSKWDETCQHRPGRPGKTKYVLSSSGKLVEKGQENVFQFPAPGPNEYGKVMDELQKKVLGAG